MPIELTIVIPTYNEYDNILPLVESLDKHFTDTKWEVIFVDDDSPDGTAAHVRQISLQDERVRCIHRVGRRGLASACIEGMLASSAPYIAVMDADLQHDESILIQMLKRLKNDDLDIVVGSRYINGGSTGELANHRVWLSKLASFASKLILKVPLNDPMSGFFILRKRLFDRILHKLSGKGFKILLDIVAAAGKSVKFAEVPYEMRSRKNGSSKLDPTVIWEYAVLLADKSIGQIVPFRFVLFALVGLTGLVVHLSVLGILYNYLHIGFWESQLSATVVAITNNFILNNLFTYRGQQLYGLAFFSGLLTFFLACSIGAIINIQLAEFIFHHGMPWWLAGTLGALVGSVWNYAITSTFTWHLGSQRS